MKRFTPATPDKDHRFKSNSRLKAIARIAGPCEADDIVQEAYLRVVERSHKEEIRSVDRLLSRVVRCIAIDRLRRRATAPKLLVPEGDFEVPDATGDPERVLIGAQRLQRAVSIVEAMPPRRREVFLLHRVEELTYRQIAVRLGISIKAVEKHLSAALAQLLEGDE